MKLVFSLDNRSLALLRIGVAAMLLLDIIIRWGYLGAHYTNEGILPLPALFRYAWKSEYFSIYTAGSGEGIITILFVINAFCIVNLLLGYKTKLFTFLCWIFLISLHNRNPLIQQAGDDLLRLLLFWGLFLPWGHRYSLDAMQPSSTISRPALYRSWGCIAYLLLLFSIYFFSALHKSSPEWTSDFTALYYALSLDQILMPLGKLVYPYESVLKFLTAFIYYTELILPFVLFLPFFVFHFRMLFLGVISMLHIGIALSINVGLFPLICIVAMLGLIPPIFYQKLEQISIKSPFFTEKYNFHQKIHHLKLYYINLFPTVKDGLFFRLSRFFKTRETLQSGLIIFFIAYTLLWNIRTVEKDLNDFGLNWIGNFLRIDQYWSMFAPSVFKDDGWFILEGTTEDGERIDIIKGEEIIYKKPDYIAGTYINDRWRKYSENILFISNSHYRKYYCFYMMSRWNRKHQRKIDKLEVIYMKIPSLPDYKEDGPFKENLCTCKK